MEGPSCDLCFLEYSSTERLPMQLLCGHTYCKACIVRARGTGRGLTSCPTCRTSLGTSEARPNYMLLRYATDVSGTDGKVTKASGLFQVYVKTLGGKTIRLEVRATDTISDLKNKIFAREGISPDQQRLICSGKELDALTALGKRTVGECGIKPEFCIHVVMRLRGGRDAE